MKNEFVNNVVCSMMDKLDSKQLQELKDALFINLCNYDIVRKNTEIIPVDDSDYNLIQKFVMSKMASGKSKRTAVVYVATVKSLFDYVGKKVVDITDDDIRRYIWYCRSEKKNKYITLRNNRAYLNSFFSWLRKNGYIIVNPMDLVEPIKPDEVVKHPFTDEELVKLRDACENKRDLAMIDFLNSSMVRVSELASLCIKDVFFSDRECIVFGKGRKERIAYFDGVAKIHLKQYLDSRSDDNPALFVSLDKNSKRLTNSGIEERLKKIGEKAGVENVHPHRFRRTGATRCLTHGMPIDQVQELMGHRDIKTTQIYAKCNRKAIKSSFGLVYA